MKETENSKIGLIGTIIFHSLLFVLLYFSAFKSPDTVPEEEGILVNFGKINNGVQTISRQRGQKTPKQIVQANIIAEKKNITAKDKINTAKKNLLTQDTEEAPSIVKNKNIKKEDKKKDQATKEWLKKLEKNNKKIKEQKKLDQLNKEKEIALKQKHDKELEAKLRQKKQEEIKKIEEERIRKIEVEKKKEEKRKIEEKKKKLEKIKEKAKNAFAKKTTPTTENKTEGNGNGNPTGFPSNTTGSPFGKGSDNSSIGTGLGSKGISFSLKGRKSSSVPIPSYNLQESGRVIVEITVNKRGIVTNARPGMPGSTTTSPALYDAAKKAAMKAKFNADPSAPEFQNGKISYTFFLN